MNKTKILVLHSKMVVLGIVAFFILLISIIMLIISLFNKSDATSASLGSKYTPGVYTASITLSGNPLDVEVCVDENNIRSITLKNTNDYIETMYPLLNNTLETLSNQIYVSNTTENIQADSNNQYTSMLLLDAINEALQKATN